MLRKWKSQLVQWKLKFCLTLHFAVGISYNFSIMIYFVKNQIIESHRISFLSFNVGYTWKLRAENHNIIHCMVYIIILQWSAKHWPFLGCLKFEKKNGQCLDGQVLAEITIFECLIFPYFWIFTDFSTFSRFFVKNFFVQWARVTCLPSLDSP